MPNHHPLEQVELLHSEVARLKRDLHAARTETQAAYVECALRVNEAKASNAKLIHALDCAIIWAEALFAWVPSGTAMPPGIEAAMNNVKRALAEVRK